MSRMSVIATLKDHYMSLIFWKVSATFQDQAALCRAAIGMMAGLMGLDEMHNPHLLDFSELVHEAWQNVNTGAIATCWVKAEIFPIVVQSDSEF